MVTALERATILLHEKHALDGDTFGIAQVGYTRGDAPTSRRVWAHFPQFADSFQRHLRDRDVDAGGDVEEVEDLALQVGEFGVEGAQQRAVGGGEFVTGAPEKISRMRAVVGAAQPRSSG